MAIFKYADRKYLTSKDLKNLIYYAANPQKCLTIHSNMLYQEDCSLIATQWLYFHTYHHKMNQNLALQYILTFDFKTESNLLSLFTLNDIAQSICKLNCFKDTNLFITLHKSTASQPEHFHIIVDTINKVSGNQVFIPHNNLTSQIGKILESHSIALAGYGGYINNTNVFQYGNLSPSLLYFAV